MRTTTSELLTELNALRLTHHLCDVALSVNGTLIYAHRVVLAAARFVGLCVCMFVGMFVFMGTFVTFSYSLLPYPNHQININSCESCKVNGHLKDPKLTKYRTKQSEILLVLRHGLVSLFHQVSLFNICI